MRCCWAPRRSLYSKAPSSLPPERSDALLVDKTKVHGSDHSIHASLDRCEGNFCWTPASSLCFALTKPLSPSLTKPHQRDHTARLHFACMKFSPHELSRIHFLPIDWENCNICHANLAVVSLLISRSDGPLFAFVPSS